MKTNFTKTFMLMMAVGMMAACSSDKELVEPIGANGEGQTPITITATYGNPQTTRVAYAENGVNINATWQTGDQIYVVFNGQVSTLDLVSGAGTATASFTGTITGTPHNNSTLVCYVKDQNKPDAATVNGDGSYTYVPGAFLSQDGTVAGAAKCNLYYGTATYIEGADISCTFSVNTSIMKFTVTAPFGVSAGDAATLTYKSGDTELAKASFTASATNTVYLSVPAGSYSGAQTLVYATNETSVSVNLSTTHANFKAGETYSKAIDYLTLSTPPLTLEATNAGNIDIQNPKSGMKYSKNGGEKQSITDNLSISVEVGDKVQFYGNGTSITEYDGTKIGGSNGVTVIAYGNIMSLVDEMGYVSNTTLLSEYTFAGLFDQNTTLTDAGDLKLPAKTLTSYCYSNMFHGCTALTTAPALPATTLSLKCYTHMFEGCTALTTAPILPAAVLVNSCYANMFAECSSLNSITCLATSMSASECTRSWVYGVADSGPFTKAADVDWRTGANGIPSGWTVVEE